MNRFKQIILPTIMLLTSFVLVACSGKDAVETEELKPLTSQSSTSKTKTSVGTALESSSKAESKSQAPSTTVRVEEESTDSLPLEKKSQYVEQVVPEGSASSSQVKLETSGSTYINVEPDSSDGAETKGSTWVSE